MIYNHANALSNVLLPNELKLYDDAKNIRSH